MKYASWFILMLLFGTSCNKKETNETETKICPAINSNLVPSVVINSFKNKYPSDIVLTWFRKDSIGYCAYFIHPIANQTLAEFTNDGNFIQQEIDIDHDGNFEDSTGSSVKGSSGCECETPE